MTISRRLFVVGLLVSLPMFVFCGFVLFTAWAAEAYNEGLFPPYVEDEWKEILILLVCSAICIGWLTGLIVVLIKKK